MQTSDALSAYRQRVVEQGQQWINGNPRHNTIDDECCPDFSCCEPLLFMSDRVDRLEYYNRQAKKYGWPIIMDS